MATNTVGLNQVFPIYNENGTPFHGLVLRKGVVDSIVMSLGDKITGEVYYEDNSLAVTMKEYVEYKTNPDDADEIPVRYVLVNPPTIVREGMVADNSELKGMTKYSFEFYHPMCQLSNFPFTDVATKSGEEKYLSQNKTFSWIGNPQDYFDKLNKNLQGTVWYVRKSDRFPTEKNNELSDVQQFDKISIAEAIKRGYEIWGVPYIVSQLPQTDPLYSQGKRFVVEYGLPSNEIYESGSSTPFVFQMGKGVGLKNNSRTPRNNKIITRISGSGSESNIPYGYPQIIWYGNQDWDYTINNNPNDPNSYPIYKGIVGGQYVKLIKHPFTRTNLMPSIYSQTVFNKVSPYLSNGQANPSYSPAIEIKDYYDAIATQEYPYTNEINPQAPSYESHEFEDIKPEFDSSESMGIVSAIPLNADLTPADHWDDSMDDDGNYLQSYFQITLPQLSFDLYACAAITQEMQINMRSGACIGCTFNVQVDWDDYKANFYDSDGNFVPDGAQRDLTKYPKSNLDQISVVVQKDNSTFGTLMPNIYQQPKANDLFVFIGISLPLSYITSAEERLDDAMKTYMLENNVYYYDYPLKFDEYFLATHANILEQIRPNSIIHFMFGGVEQQLFVKQLTVKYNNTPLPQYDITLTDNIEVVLNQIGQVVDDIEKLSSLLSVLRQSYNRNVWNELAKKLSKTQDDTASGYIRMLKGLQVGANFVPDILGEGGVLRMRSDGKVELVTDILYARMKAYFDTVEIREYQHTAGNRIASVAGNKCVRVAWFNSSNVELEQTQANISSVDYFRCFFRASDGEDTVRNNFKVGDQAYCHITSVDGSSDNPEQKGFNQKHYWRLVVGRNVEGTLTDDNEGWIDLSNRSEVTIGGINYQGYQSSSDVPQAQDDIIQLGNVNDTTRQGAVVEYVTGTDAPSYQIYQGINSFSLNGKNQIGFGYNTGTGRAYMNVYGDFRFGSRNNNGSYIKYNSQTGNLEIKAHVEFTNSDSELDTIVQEHQRDDSYDDSWIQPAIDELQDQIDGAIETYYMVGQPALNLPPVISTQEHPYDEPWLDGTETQEERTKILNNHVGDLYYDKDTGHGYRFLYDDSSRSFVWVRITDEDIEAALEAANNAQATADGKMTIYSIWGAWVKNSVNTLKVGDLFIPANDTTQGSTTYYSGKVYKCIVAGQNSFSEINYTDDSALNAFKANQYVQQLTNGTITGNITNAQNAADNAQDAADTAKSTAEGAASAAAALGYLSQALGQNTEVVGGLVLSTLIALRDANNNTWSGINGAYQQSETGTGYKGHGIAAWYGGAMVDKEVVTTATDYAKSLFRFDGSGYLASGNITWDANGVVTIANVYANIGGSSNVSLTGTLQTLTNLSNALPITLQSSVTYLDPQYGFTNLSILGKPVATQEWVGNNYVSKAFFEAIFKPEDSSGNRVSTNGTTSGVLDRLKILVGAYTDQYLSALGLNNNSGGGGTGDVTWELLASSSDTRQIALSHLTTALSGYATTSNLSGYLPLTGGTLTGSLTATGYIASSATVMTCTSIGSGIYNSMVWDFEQSGFCFEFPNSTDSATGAHTPINIGWRGGVYPVTIDASGDVILNSTINRGLYLRINGKSGDGYGNISVDGDGLNINASNTAGRTVYLNPDVYVDNTLEVSSNLYVGDHAYINNDCEAASFIQTSDIRNKDIVGDVCMNLYNVSNAPLFKFTWKNKKDSGVHVGSAAQYWQTILPELVSVGTDESMTLGMQYDVIALASTITVAKTVVDHEERIKILENENKKLRKQIKELKSA